MPNARMKDYRSSPSDMGASLPVLQGQLAYSRFSPYICVVAHLSSSFEYLHYAKEDLHISSYLSPSYYNYASLGCFLRLDIISEGMNATKVKPIDHQKAVLYASANVEIPAISPRVLSVPFDLIRYEFLTTHAPVSDHAIEEIVDEIFLPIVMK